MRRWTLPEGLNMVSKSANRGKSGLPAWRVILAMVRFRPWLWFIDLLSVIVFRVAMQLGPGLVMRQFFNMIESRPASSGHAGLLAIVAMLVALFLGRALGGYGFYYADVPIFADVATLLRKNLLRHILRRPGASPLPDSPGEAVSRFRNDVIEIPLFVIWINDIMTGLFLIAISIAIMTSINAWITVLALLPVVVVGIIANAASSRIERYRRASREATGKVTGFIGELFGAVQAVKVASAETGVIGYFDELNLQRRNLTLRERLFDTILDTIWRNTASLGTGVILILAGQAMRAGTFTIGDFSLFVYLLQSLSDLTTFAGMIAARYKQLGVSVERMYRLMEGAPREALVQPALVDLDGPLPDVAAFDEEVGRDEGLAPDAGEDHLETLEARGLSFHFPNGGIDRVNLSLRRGELVVVTGRVGSGKTTLLRVLLGLLPVEAGEIRWNGKLVTDPGTFFTPPRCAYTAQTPRLFSQTLRENILLGLPKTDDEARLALYRAVMEDDLQVLEDGLDTHVGPRGVKLSGGQAQRAAAARMFIREPDLLVFDDLSSALDVETEKTLWERLYEGWKGEGLKVERLNFVHEDDLKTTHRQESTFQSSNLSTFYLRPTAILAVSHRRAVLKMADRVLIMKDGQVAAEGKLEDLLETCQEMRSLWAESRQ